MNVIKNTVEHFRRVTGKNWPQPVKYFGGGVNGRVYETNNGRLMKITQGNSSNEFKAMLALSTTRAAPRVVRNNVAVARVGNLKNTINKALFPNSKFNGNTYTIFFMNKVGGNRGMTAENYKKKFINANNVNAGTKERRWRNMQMRIEHLVTSIHEKGIVHQNLHFGNFIVEVTPTGNISRMWLIDFGRSKKMNQMNVRNISNNNNLNWRYGINYNFKKVANRRKFAQNELAKYYTEPRRPAVLGRSKSF